MDAQSVTTDPQPENDETQTSVQQASQQTPQPLNTLQIKSRIIEVLSTVYDPEIPVNIYDLGLIYDITVDTAAAVVITMTLTAPTCPVAQTLPDEVANKVRQVPGVTDVKVDLVWDPPWDRDKMSETAKLQLGLW